MYYDLPRFDHLQLAALFFAAMFVLACVFGWINTRS
jgi:hypothetical protein